MTGTPHTALARRVRAVRDAPREELTALDDLDTEDDRAD